MFYLAERLFQRDGRNGTTVNAGRSKGFADHRRLNQRSDAVVNCDKTFLPYMT